VTQFVYRAFNAQGAITSGTIVAEAREAAIEALYGNGLTPFETYAASSQERNRPRRADAGHPWVQFLVAERTNLNARALSRFTVELSSLIGSGIALDEAFRVMAVSDRGSVGRTASALLKDVLAGAQLSQAMRTRPKTFGGDYCAIVAAGEAAGALAPALAQIAGLLARRLELRSKISAALVYPAVLVLMSIVSVGVIIGILVPSLTPVFADAGLPLPGVLAWFAWLEDNIAKLSLLSALFLLLLVVLFRILSRNPTARLRRDQVLCSLPMVGRLISLREGAGFARALGTLVCARASLMSALETAKALINNREIRRRCATAIALVPGGMAVSKAFANTELFPPAALSLLAVGEETGQLGQLLVEVAKNLEGELHQRIERIVTLLTPTLTLAIGAAVGGLILQVMTAVLSINDLAFR
jgi:general secretion pathway protein F